MLAGSAAYALGEAFGWHVGLSRKPQRAKAFYGAIAAAGLIGGLLNFVQIDPIKALFWIGVINGVAGPGNAPCRQFRNRNLPGTLSNQR